MGNEQASPLTPIDRRSLQPQEHEHKPREIPAFRPHQQQPQETTFSQRVDNAVKAVKEFFGFADALKGNEPAARRE